MTVDHVPPVTPRDRMLVEWVAQAKVGDPLPAAMVPTRAARWNRSCAPGSSESMTAA
jgi:hypothetical protein